MSVATEMATELATELAIGQVAEATGLGVTVIRYYDDIGLITPTRRVGGKRRFGPDVVGRLSFVLRAKNAGFSLDDIKTLLDDRHRAWPDIVDRRLADLRLQREQLDVMISTLEAAQRCGCDVVAHCPKLPPC